MAEQLKASAALAKNDSDRRDREALGARLDVLAVARCAISARSPRGRPDALANGDLERDLRALSRRVHSAARDARATRRSRTRETALDRNASPKIVADWIALQL